MKTGFHSPGKLRLPLMLLFLAAFPAIAPACGENAPQTGTSNPSPASGAKIYSTSPASTSELLKDASDAVKSIYGDNQGVHFTMESSAIAPGQSANSRYEGDMVFPDSVRMSSSDILTRDPVSVDLISVGGKVYTRSAATDNAWKGGGAVPAPPPDPQTITGFLAYARGSRNFGQEILGSGVKTWHVQVDVDTGMMSTEAMKGVSDPASLQELESMRSAVVTADYWIGADDLLPYQMLVKTDNAVSGSSSEKFFVFSDWKEVVNIEAPCEDC